MRTSSAIEKKFLRGYKVNSLRILQKYHCETSGNISVYLFPFFNYELFYMMKYKIAKKIVKDSQGFFKPLNEKSSVNLSYYISSTCTCCRSFVH